MSDTIPQSVSIGCRKYVKSRIIINTFNTFNNVVMERERNHLGIFPYRGFGVANMGAIRRTTYGKKHAIICLERS